MKATEILELFDQIIIRKVNGEYYAALETVKPPNQRHAILASGESSPSPTEALKRLLDQEIVRCPECQNRMEWANQQTRDGIEFLPRCPSCKRIGSMELQAEGVTI